MPRNSSPPTNLSTIDPQESGDASAITTDDWRKAVEHLRSVWSGSNVEQAALVHRTASFNLLSIQHFTMGDDHHIALDHRELLTGIAMRDSEAVLLCHSHPVGQATPSRADIDATRNLAHICTMLRVELVDHVILSGEDSFSFREAGLL